MRFLWPILLLVLVLLAALGPRLWTASVPAEDRLVLLSPHWDGIQQEFERGFQEHWLKETGRRVELVWLEVGGTGDIRRYIEEQARKADFAAGEGIGVDLFFGGGVFDHAGLLDGTKLADKGIRAPDGLLAPHEPPGDIRAAIPEEVNGQRLREPGNRWHAACLSGFGFVYNTHVIRRAQLPAPKTWADLARPEYRGWISVGDPAKSGSLHMAFEIVLQAHGWDEGWGVLARTIANAPAFNEGGSSIPRDVSLGQAAAGPCIDFYAAAPIRRQGATHLEFVFPEGLSVITPDPISILRNPPNERVARAFVDFVLSADGQKLWYQKRGSPGGPTTFDLERLPVRKDLYVQELPTWTVARPFEEGQAFAYDEAKGGRRWGLSNDLFQSVLVDVHADLQEAWKAAIEAGRAEDLGAALGRPPFPEAALFEVGQAGYGKAEMNRLRTRWTGWARRRYRAIRDAARAHEKAPAYRPAPVDLSEEP